MAVLPGDGIGPEIVTQAIKVLETVGKGWGHEFNFKKGLVGGAAIDEYGVALNDETLQSCKKSDAVLLGAVGGPKWDDPLAKVRPEDGLLALRKELRLFANLRPVKTYSILEDSTNLKPEVIHGVDMLVVRELTGGLYFGRPKKRWQTPRGRRAVDSMLYSEHEIERIIRVGFEMARERRRKLTSVDKANVLESSRLWRQIAIELSPEYPDVELDHMLVDACTMRLIQKPTYFDVIVTENTFGDIITDEASMLAGSLGMLPSASLGAKAQRPTRSKVEKASAAVTFGMYEPIHGSAPSRAGQDIANPIATILSCAMMLRYSLGLQEAAVAIEQAVEEVLEEGYRTYDIMKGGKEKVGTERMGELIAGRVRQKCPKHQ
jgi:3-isopropylmalate dehydrogenase